MRVAGIDYSSFAIDVALVTLEDPEGDDPQYHHYPLSASPDKAFDRTRMIGEVMPGRGSEFWDSVLAVGIEAPRGKHTSATYRVQGAVLSMIPSSTLVVDFSPKVWRNAVGLRGDCPKERIFERAIDLGAAPTTQDQADAYCLALATVLELQKEARRDRAGHPSS